MPSMVRNVAKSIVARGEDWLIIRCTSAYEDAKMCQQKSSQKHSSFTFEKLCNTSEAGKPRAASTFFISVRSILPDPLLSNRLKVACNCHHARHMFWSVAADSIV